MNRHFFRMVFSFWVLLLMVVLMACTASEDRATSSPRGDSNSISTDDVAITDTTSLSVTETPARSEPTATPQPTATSTVVETTTEETPSESSEDGMVLHETDEFSIQLPERMEVLDSEERLTQEALQQFGNNNPALAGMTPDEQDLDMIQLYALETDIPEESVGGFNFILFRIPLSGVEEIELERDVVAPFVNAYEESGITVIEVDTTMQLAGTSAAGIAYEVPMNLPSGGTITGGILQYLVLGNENLWIFNYTIEIERAEELVPLADQSAQSFNLKREAPTTSQSESPIESQIVTTFDDVPAGTARHETDEFSILLPVEWDVTDPVSSPPDEISPEVLEANPNLAATMERPNYDVLLASEIPPPGQNHIALSIAREPFLESEDGIFEENVDVTANQIRQTEGFTLLEVEKELEVAGRTAARISVELDLNLPSGDTLTAGQIQYQVLDGEIVWVLLFTFPETRTNELIPIIDQTIQSFQLKTE